MPTTLTSDLDELFDTLDKFAQAKSKLKDGPNLHGLHLAGTTQQRQVMLLRYFSKSRRNRLADSWSR